MKNIKKGCFNLLAEADAGLEYGFLSWLVERRKKSKAPELEEEGCLEWVSPTEVDLSMMVLIR